MRIGVALMFLLSLAACSRDLTLEPAPEPSAVVRCRSSADCAALDDPADACLRGACGTDGLCVVALRDADEDGFADARCAGAGHGTADDCADDDPAIHPGAAERCDGADDDCDGATDEEEAGPLCAPAHGVAVCEAGVCRVTSCEPGWLDCGGGVEDGCELDGRTDVQHCGVCGNACGAAGACVDGACDEVVALTAGGQHSCALRAQGGVACWGLGRSGQLDGDTSRTEEPLPRAVGALAPATGIAAGGSHTCAQLGDGTVACWGLNAEGQLGSGAANVSRGTSLVAGVTQAGALGAARAHTCLALEPPALDRLVCFGNGALGELGPTGAPSSPSPVPVPLAADVRGIALGDDHSCVWEQGGGVECFGVDGHGELGRGAGDQSGPTPAAVTLPDAASAVASGSHHACAIVAGAVFCWGRGDFGQLGDGGEVDAQAPVRVIGLADADAVAAGQSFSCALHRGQVSCWGDDALGQLGDGGGAPSSVPVRVPGISGAIALAAGRAHACALLGSGDVLCWGDNGSGQTGALAVGALADVAAVGGL